jgi:hypothetical protein
MKPRYLDFIAFDIGAFVSFSVGLFILNLSLNGRQLCWVESRWFGLFETALAFAMTTVCVVCMVRYIKGRIKEVKHD